MFLSELWPKLYESISKFVPGRDLGSKIGYSALTVSGSGLISDHKNSGLRPNLTHHFTRTESWYMA